MGITRTTALGRWLLNEPLGRGSCIIPKGKQEWNVPPRNHGWKSIGHYFHAQDPIPPCCDWDAGCVTENLIQTFNNNVNNKNVYEEKCTPTKIKHCNGEVMRGFSDMCEWWVTVFLWNFSNFWIHNKSQSICPTLLVERCMKCKQNIYPISDNGSQSENCILKVVSNLEIIYKSTLFI